MKHTEEEVLHAYEQCRKLRETPLHNENVCKECPYFAVEACQETMIDDIAEHLKRLALARRKPVLTLGMLLDKMDNEDPVIIRTNVGEYDSEMTVLPDSLFVKRYEGCAVETIGTEDKTPVVYIEVKDE